MMTMHELLDFVKNLHSEEGLRSLIQNGGLLALTAIVFAETGLLAGFFLPGDSLLVTAGIFAASDGMGGPGLFNIWTLNAVLITAAIVGDQVGYLLGKKTGHLAFQKEDSRFFKKKHLVAAHEFYEKHGARALIIARFVPILRTFVPFAAGVAEMDYRHFVRYNVVGGLLWVLSMTLLGYALGHTELANQLHKIIIVVVFVSILPLIFSAYKALQQKRAKT